MPMQPMLAWIVYGLAVAAGFAIGRVRAKPVVRAVALVLAVVSTAAILGPIGISVAYADIVRAAGSADPAVVAIGGGAILGSMLVGATLAVGGFLTGRFARLRARGRPGLS